MRSLRCPKRFTRTTEAVDSCHGFRRLNNRPIQANKRKYRTVICPIAVTLWVSDPMIVRCPLFDLRLVPKWHAPPFISDQTYTYEAWTVGFVGTDTFEYEVSDGLIPVTFATLRSNAQQTHLIYQGLSYFKMLRGGKLQS